VRLLTVARRIITQNEREPCEHGTDFVRDWAALRPLRGVQTRLRETADEYGRISSDAYWVVRVARGTR
jgi:hypothetical protein